MSPVIACPRCGKAVDLDPARRATDPAAAFAPFCSRRCKLSDLGAWDDGAYVVGRPLTYDDLAVSDFDERGDQRL